jgi:hypothetical protein
MVSGPEHTPVEYQLATKASYALRDDLSVGLENYNGLGEGGRLGRFAENDQSTYVVADKSFGKWDLNLGVGYGYGHPEDRWTVKAIIGVPIDWR